MKKIFLVFVATYLCLSSFRLFAEEENKESLFLREESILSTSGHFSSELGIFFQRLTRGNISANALRQETGFVSLTMRYGIGQRVELSLSAPYMYVQNNISVANSSFSNDSSDGWGDVSASLKYQLWFDSETTPDLILSASVDSDSGDVDETGGPSLGSGHWEYSFSALMATAFDPAIYFVQLGYRFVEPEMFAGQRKKPGDTLLYRFGSGFALTDKVIISFQLVGEANQEGEYGNAKIAKSHEVSFQFANTILLSRNWFIEPLVSFGLTPEAPDILFGISFPL